MIDVLMSFLRFDDHVTIARGQYSTSLTSYRSCGQRFTSYWACCVWALWWWWWWWYATI